jgi:hypothetical protein
MFENRRAFWLLHHCQPAFSFPIAIYRVGSPVVVDEIFQLKNDR